MLGQVLCACYTAEIQARVQDMFDTNNMIVGLIPTPLIVTTAPAWLNYYVLMINVISARNDWKSSLRAMMDGGQASAMSRGFNQ